MPRTPPAPEILPLHRGFVLAERSFGELPDPVRPFASARHHRPAAHVELPLGPPAEVEQPPSPIRFPDREQLEREHVLRVAAQAIDEPEAYEFSESAATAGLPGPESEALRAADYSGFTRGLRAGWWRGFHQTWPASALLGLLAGGLLVAFFIRLGSQQ